MKERLTFLPSADSGLSKDDLLVRPDRLEYTKAHLTDAEWRLTLGVDEVPDELRAILKDSHELHLRWTSTKNRIPQPPNPIVSRLPPGLHAFFTPRLKDLDVPLCNLVDRLFFADSSSPKCVSVRSSFSRPAMLSERFSASSTYQFYAVGGSPGVSGDAVLSKLCGIHDEAACGSWRTRLEDARSLDIDFDLISHTFVLTAQFSQLFHPEASNKGLTVRKVKDDQRLEVGVLRAETTTEPEEIQMGGFLAVLGETGDADTVLFSFPSRHHALPASSNMAYAAHFRSPTGLHPTLHLTFTSHSFEPPAPSCALHAYWTLPSPIFLDRYQFADPVFLASHNLGSLRSLSGAQDLEAPDWTVSPWGSAALLELATPSLDTKRGDNSWTVTVPTHLRYVPAPSLEQERQSTSPLFVPHPSIFWACTADQGLKMSTNPFDRINLGYDALFGPKTIFYHVPPASETLNFTLDVEIPVLDPVAARAGHVELGTLVVVIMGFAWILSRMTHVDNKKN